MKRRNAISHSKISGSFRGNSANENKSEKLILYVSEHGETHETFGPRKPNKILFLTDYRADLELGTPIVGVPDRKLGHEPVSRRLVYVREALKEAGGFAIRPDPHRSFAQARGSALRDPDLSGLMPGEITLVDSVIEELKHDT